MCLQLACVLSIFFLCVFFPLGCILYALSSGNQRSPGFYWRSFKWRTYVSNRKKEIKRGGVKKKNIKRGKKAGTKRFHNVTRGIVLICLHIFNGFLGEISTHHSSRSLFSVYSLFSFPMFFLLVTLDWIFSLRNLDRAVFFFWDFKAATYNLNDFDSKKLSRAFLFFSSLIAWIWDGI